MVKLRFAESTIALSPAGLAIWVPLGIFRTIVREPEHSGVELLGAILVLAISALVAAWLVRATVLRNQVNYDASIGRTFISYLLVLLLLRSAQGVFAYSIGADFSFSPARVLTGLVVLYVVAYLLSYVDRYRRGISELRAEQQQLDRVRAASARGLMHIRSELVAILSERVAPAKLAIAAQLTSLRGAPRPTSLRAMAEQVRSDLIDPIRSFSYEIEQMPSTVGPDDRVKNYPVRVQWRKLVASIPTVQPFNPIAGGVTATLIGLVNVEHFNQLVTVLTAAGAGVTLAASLAVAKIFFTPLLNRFKPIGQWCLCVGAYFLASLPAFFVLWGPWSRQTVIATPMALFAIPVAMLIMVIWAVIGAASAMAAQTESELRATVELTRREASALEREEVLERRAIAHILHGEVQSILTTAAFRLDLASQATTADSTAIGDVQTMMSAAFARIDSIATLVVGTTTDGSDTDQRSVTEQLADLCSSWSGIVTVTLYIDPLTAEQLETRVNDASLAPVVVDIVREAILNATRHARASKIEVRITTVANNCRITVINNGKTPAHPAPAGLGHQMLDQLHCTWTLNPGASGGAVLDAHLPLLTSTSHPRG